MSELKVHPVDKFSAELRVPGDKSISHRSVMFGALSNGTCEIEGFLASEDCLATVGALKQLGVEIKSLNEDATKLMVKGCRGKFKQPTEPIDCGNSGTTMRLMCGLLAGCDFEVELTGDDSLSRRPMDRIAKPLKEMGVSITGQGKNCTAPLKVRGTTEIKNINYESPVASAQVKSAIMLAALAGSGKTTISEPYLSRDHSERMLNYLLVKNVRDGNTTSIWGGQQAESRDIIVPGDLSSAAFWVVAAAARPGSTLLVNGVGLNPTRVGILNALIRMGARINERVDESNCEPMGTVEVTGSTLKGIEIGGEEIPKMIDEIPVLAVAAALAEGNTTIRDAHELRVKESDRISAVADNLRRMGVPVQEFADGMEIQGVGPQGLKAAEIESHGDHRIAMAFAIAGLYANGETVIHNSDCIATSYPGFEDELVQLLRRK